MSARTTYPAFLALALLALAGCRRAPGGWTPVLANTGTSFLETEVARSLDRVAAARQRVRSDPGQAEELLAAAQEGLASLDRVYLPLFRARSRAYNAYRYHYLGRDDAVARELESIEETVLRASRDATGPLLGELEHIQEVVADARIELEAGSPGLTATLRRLAETMEAFVAKGDIFL